MTIELSEAKAQLKQSLHKPELVAELSDSAKQTDPILFWILGDAIGMAMLKSETGEMNSFVIGLQGTLFSGKWDTPQNEHENQIELFSDQVRQRIGADRVTKENVELRLSEMNLTDLLVILYQLRSFSTKADTRKRVLKNIDNTMKENEIEKYRIPVNYIKQIIGDKVW